MLNNQVWFSGRDVAVALGYKDTVNAVKSHVDDEDKKIFKGGKTPPLKFPIPNRGLTIINESGLYSLILCSKLPSAKQFKRWVTSD